MPIEAATAWLIPGLGLVSGLIATYVSLQNRALLARASVAASTATAWWMLRRAELCDPASAPTLPTTAAAATTATGQTGCRAIF